MIFFLNKFLAIITKIEGIISTIITPFTPAIISNIMVNLVLKNNEIFIIKKNITPFTVVLFIVP